ncbi:MAG TPA: hypothetical protein VFF73_17185 [Planctomycetota bacterium]|nr:hypothetical protein [Planctomycetota bacterium]
MKDAAHELPRGLGAAGGALLGEAIEELAERPLARLELARDRVAGLAGNRRVGRSGLREEDPDGTRRRGRARGPSSSSSARRR